VIRERIYPQGSQFSVLFRRRWQLVGCDVVGSGVAGFDLGFHASRILCLDQDSSRTGAFGNEVDVVQVHTLYISRLFEKQRILIDWEILPLDHNDNDICFSPSGANRSISGKWLSNIVGLGSW
jgi:hypothetical protein